MFYLKDIQTEVNFSHLHDLFLAYSGEMEYDVL